MSKLINLDLLISYDGLIKTHIADADKKSIKAITFDDTTNTIKFYKTEATTGNPDYSIKIPANVDISNKADAATTLEGYGITDAYTKIETDAAIANAGHLKRSIVNVLPDVASANDNTIYMVTVTNGSGEQKYEEFMLVNGSFEKIGDSAVDLTDYTTKTYVNDLNNETNNRIASIENNISNVATNAEIEALFN